MGIVHHRARGFGGTADGQVWEVGLVTLPATVTGENGVPFQPLAILVLEAGGALRAMTAGHPDRPLPTLKEAIDRALNHPEPPCEPGEPRRVVVDNARLLELVPPLLPGVLVSKGATPRFQEAAKSLREHMASLDGERGLKAMTTDLTADVTPDVVREFFEVAAALHHRRPWRRIPSDGHLFQVTCTALGIRGWTGCVIGQNQESFGVILFDSVADVDRYVEAGEDMEEEEDDNAVAFPPHRAINFDPKQALPKELPREIRSSSPLCSGSGWMGNPGWPASGGNRNRLAAAFASRLVGQP